MNIFAADVEKTIFSDMKNSDYYAEAATKLVESGILTGYPDGTFGAEKTITRAEMATIVCRMIDKEADAENSVGATIFDDVSDNHWANGYINIASKEGIINGDGNGKFRPEDDVKHEEAIKMVVCALGYGDNVVVDPADWSKAYLDIANEKGISSNLKGTKGKASTRGDIAVMSYAGIKAVQTDAKAESIVKGTPVASVAEGTYTSSQKVTLTSAIDGATIYYTTNGKTPTTKSTKYISPITISKTTTLMAIAVKNGKTLGDVMSVVYTINTKAPAGGGGGGGGGGGSSSTPITAAEFQVGGSAITTANVGDTLTFITTPAGATGTVKWTIGGNEVSVTGNSYTVNSFDMGKTIKAQITGNGAYQGTATATCTVANSVQVTAQNIMSNNADSSPVVLTNAANTTFLDDSGSPVTVDASSTLTLSIENPEKSTEEVSQATTVVIQDIISNSSATAADLSDVTAVAVDVNLSVDETAVHPVGDVTVTLSAEQLGLPEGTDLANYTFSANHTNKNNQNEIVPGTVVTIDGVQYVRFELNGLSTVWIGNIPPRTVSFYNSEEDADNKVNSIGSVVVKFGDLTPTAKIPTVSLSGYLFCGWNYDMTRTPIISNLEVHALWVEGVKMPASSINAVLSESTSDLTPEISDGLVSLDDDGDTLLPSNLDVKVSVSAPQNAVKYYAGTDAAVVAAFNNADEYLDVNTTSEIYFEIDVTNENGVIIPSSNAYYCKWIDETGNVIAVEEVKVKIANGSDGATSMEYTANVNRGIGTFEAYLINSNDSSKDFVSYINNHLNGNAIEGYTLRSNISFDGYKNNYNFNSYDLLKFIFTPFDGETYDNTDTISATGEYYSGNTWNENWTGSYQIDNGKLIVTYPFNTTAMTDEYAYIYITVNGVVQEIDINWDNGGYGNGDSEYLDCATWAEVLAALPSVTTTKEYYFECTDSSAITLSTSLTIPANVDINLRNAPSFTVANGATLTLVDDTIHNSSSSLNVRDGNFIVTNGGTVTSTYTGTNQGSRYYPSIRAKNITFSSGAKLTIPEDTLISLYTNSYNESEKGILNFESGSIVNNSGNLHTNDFDVINLNGTFNASYYTYLYGDEINVGGQINMTSTNWARFELYGTVTVNETGSIIANSTSNRKYTNLEIYGPLTNKGTIEIKGSLTDAIIMNNGFVNYNEGTISVANGCSITTSGTKFINAGLITGSGVINASLGDDYTNYDDGTDYIIVENDEYWDETLEEYVYILSDYSRYKYTHDPASTVDVTLYLAEIVNIGGQCTLTVNSEEFPQD